MSFLERLVELLSVPQQGCDVLLPNDGAHSQEWLEYHCSVLHPSVGGTDPEVSPASRPPFGARASRGEGCTRMFARGRDGGALAFFAPPGPRGCISASALHAGCHHRQLRSSGPNWMRGR